MDTSSPPDSCAVCGSSNVESERICEHDCGYVAPRAAYQDDRCPKCDRVVSDASLERVSTVDCCLDCGQRFDKHHDVDAETLRERSTPDVDFPDLPSPGDKLSWLPGRFVPDSERGRQIAASILVVLVLTSGLVGAVTVTPYLQPEEFDGDSRQNADVDRTWNEYETVVMFRNDDIQPWYEKESLRKVDQVFIEEDVPVTHGVIPAVSNEADITEDQELCGYLTDLTNEHPELFEMALHGYTHEQQTDFLGASEFGDVPIETQRDWLERGERIHESCVGTAPETFVPPLNTYDSNTVAALDERGYTTVSGARWATNEQYNESAVAFEEGGLTHVSMFEDASMVRWDTDDHDDHEYYDLEELEAEFDRAYENNVPYVHMLHYFTFTEEEHYDLLREFIQYMKSKDDVAFMTVGEFGSGLENGEIEATDDGWRVLEPEDGQGETGRSSDSDSTGPFSEIFGRILS